MTKGLKSLNKTLSRATREAMRLHENMDDVFTLLTTYSSVVGIHSGRSDEELISLFKQLLTRSRMGMSGS